MAEICNRKLIVEICNAKNLMPKDGQGTSSAYVIVDFDGQRRRTKTVSRDLNPQWDEKLEFLVHDSESISSQILELNLYNDKNSGKRSNFLGKVKIAGATFVKSGSETLVYYPLEKRSVFSQIKGEIGLRICYVDEDPPVSDASAVKPDQESQTPVVAEEKPADVEAEKKEEKVEESAAAKNEEKAPEVAKTEDAKAPPPETAPAEVDNPPIAHAEPIQKSETRKQLDLNVKDIELRPVSGDRSRNGFELVDRMLFLFVRVVKAKQTKSENQSGTYAKLVIGTHNVQTESQINKDWDQVFAFDKETLNSTSLEVSVLEEKNGNEGSTDTNLGSVSFDLQEVPKRVPPDSPLAPQWYTVEGSSENDVMLDVMLSVWFGTQADEAFQEAWQSDSGGLIPETRAKVYLSPKLWYLRLTVIQTQDLQLGSASEAELKSPELYVKAQLGAQVFKTGRTTVGSSSSANPTWNEDLVFVAAEPFEPFLVVSVEDVATGPVGHAKVHVASVDKRVDEKSEARSKWFNLSGDESRPYAGRIHMRVCLEGGYHVLDEAAQVTSDVRATANQLAKPAIGLLEIGIRGATNLLPVKTKDGTIGTTDAYVVVKYGPKWVRTRTILDRFNPRWNEQYTWDVYDPCTVITIGVFDNGRYKLGKDIRVGKLRLRLSTMDTNRVYLNSYPLTVLLSGGAKKMGEIEIAVRFSCSSWLNLIQGYASPMLPRMHFLRPFGPAQQDILRYTAMRIVTTRLARSEPPLDQEVVQFMLDSNTHVWSMRRCKTNWFRVVGCLSRAVAFARWLDGVRTWTHPPTTILVHILIVAIVLCPHLILPSISLYAFLIVSWRFRYRQRAPLNMDPRLSHIDAVSHDELDEEFDSIPTTKSSDQVRIRYDRLRALAGRAQSLLGDMAAQGERVEALLNWRDPRATGIFIGCCLLASFVFYLLPFKVFVLGFGLYYLRHPRFRDDMPSAPINFFRRLPSLSDQIL